MTRKKVKIKIDKKVRKRLKKLKVVGDSYSTIINRIIDYIEFHPEYWSRRI